jgi:hypothetical protein
VDYITKPFTLLGNIARWQGDEKPQDDISILAVELSVTSRLRDVGADSVERQLAMTH